MGKKVPNLATADLCSKSAGSAAEKWETQMLLNFGLIGLAAKTNHFEVEH